ncbi:MAG: esterase-like activity of phytase family protein [Erythrobacter sp.]
MRRLILTLAVAIGLSPGTWLRTETTQRDFDAPITVTPIAVRDGVEGPLALTGAWTLSSRNDHFGGYSALIWLGDDRLLAGSDRGRLLEIMLGVEGPVAEGAKLSFVPGRGETKREFSDLEALTIDHSTGTIWAAFESRNIIERRDAQGKVTRRRPPEIGEWSANSGPESLVRFADGRFLLLAEGFSNEDITDRAGLLFASDPAEVTQSTAFRFGSPSRFRPVDAALLPSGEVMILLRRVRYTFPATFDAMLMQADPAEIEADAVWTGEIVARISGEHFGENLEGITFVPDADNPAAGSLYLIADDNLSAFQTSLMLRFAWPIEGE